MEADLFKRYLSDDAFSDLARHYDDYRYRFEVPADRFEHVRDVLDDHGYAPSPSWMTRPRSWWWNAKHPP